MEQLLNFLSSLRGDVFKLLPMKEDEMAGVDNHLGDYIEALLINLEGATTTYPILANQKQYLYVINNLQYASKHPIDFKKWRKIVLNSTRNIDNLDSCRHNTLGMYQLCQLIQAFIRNSYHTHIRFYCAERKVCRLRFGVRQTVKKSRFTYVGQSNNTAFQCHDDIFNVLIFKFGCEDTNFCATHKTLNKHCQ